jgi:hypothetical protein
LGIYAPNEKDKDVNNQEQTVKDLQKIAHGYKSSGPLSVCVQIPYHQKGLDFQTKVRSLALKKSSHDVISLAKMDKDISEFMSQSAIKSLIEQTPYLWKTCPHEPEKGHSEFTFTFDKGNVTDVSMSLTYHKPAYTQQNTQLFSQVKLQKSGEDLTRLFTMLSSFEGPYGIWTTKNKTGSITEFKAPHSGSGVLIIDRLMRAFQSTLRKQTLFTMRPNYATQYSDIVMDKYENYDHFYD